MPDLVTTKMSSKGDVIIPEEIRKRLNLKSGSQFVVIADNDVVVLKNITPPTMEEFDTLIAQARAAGKEAGLKKKDIQEMIKQVREDVKK
jgi:AbrB family looped-hinge helix DNA binding protein